MSDIEAAREIVALVRRGVGVRLIAKQYGLDQRTSHRVVDRIRQRIALEAEARDKRKTAGSAWQRSMGVRS